MIFFCSENGSFSIYGNKIRKKYDSSLHTYTYIQPYSSIFVERFFRQSFGVQTFFRQMLPYFMALCVCWHKIVRTIGLLLYLFILLWNWFELTVQWSLALFICFFLCRLFVGVLFSSHWTNKKGKFNSAIDAIDSRMPNKYVQKLKSMNR